MVTSADETFYNPVISNAAFAIGICILYYDHALTFDDEIKYFWRWPVYRGNLLFFLNRYFSFFSHLILLAMRYFRSPHSSCGSWQLLNQLTLSIAQFFVLLILIIRTYALYNRDKRIVVLLVVVCFAGAVISSIAFVQGRQHAGTAIGTSGSDACAITIPDENVKHVIVPWLVQFGLDMLVVTLTLWRTWSFPRHGHGLPQTIRRDGAVYFGAIASANLANIVTFYVFPPGTRGCLGTFASCVSVTMISRLIINLQQPTETSYMTSGPVDIVEDGSIFGRDDKTLDSFHMQSFGTFASDDVERYSGFGSEAGLISPRISRRDY